MRKKRESYVCIDKQAFLNRKKLEPYQRLDNTAWYPPLKKRWQSWLFYKYAHQVSANARCLLLQQLLKEHQS